MNRTGGGSVRTVHALIEGRAPLPGEEGTLEISPEIQGQNLAWTVVCVPYSLDIDII